MVARIRQDKVVVRISQNRVAAGVRQDKVVARIRRNKCSLG